MKLAFVVHRYGPEVSGGPEHLCRLLAERLASQHEVDVLTTCARDSVSWANVYAEGFDRIRGVNVRRFANSGTRDLDAFNQYSDWISSHSHTRADELKWLQLQGPWCPALIEWLRRTEQQYDVMTFFNYRHAPTVMGLDVNPGKSVVVAAACDEPFLPLEIFKDVFRRPAALCYLNDSERLFVQGRFSERPLLEEVVGIGVEHEPRLDEDEETRPSWIEALDEPSPTEEARPHLVAKGSTFRRRHRLHGAVVLHGGRIDPGKGCEELIEYFGGYKAAGGKGVLALMGVKLMALPVEPWIRLAGQLSDSERLQALDAATVVVCPSPEDSLPLSALEAMAMGTPVLVNAQSAALVEHCRQGNSGLYYANREEFVECLRVLVEDPDLCERLGRNGRHYVRAHYRWDIVLGRFERIFSQVRNAR